MLYIAESVRCAFWEAVARNRFTRRRRRELPRSDVEARLAVSVRSHEDLVLIDLLGGMDQSKLAPLQQSLTTQTKPQAGHCPPLLSRAYRKPMAFCFSPGSWGSSV